jgi:hypothetical protein
VVRDDRRHRRERHPVHDVPRWTECRCGIRWRQRWRLPSFAELLTIQLPEDQEPCSLSPCIDPIFGPTKTSIYSTSVTYALDPELAAVVGFQTANAAFGNKGVVTYARAVRDGF